MFKLALNAGHYLGTSGKRCLKSLDPKETKEWVLNDRICDKIEKKLSEYTGYSLLRIDDTTGAKETTLTTRTNKANKWGADFYLSIHHNAGVKGGNGGGVVAYTYTKVDENTKAWQIDLYNEIIRLTGLKGNRAKPLGAADLHECRETKMPAVLLECGFMDSKTDTPIILTDAFADKIATACVNVIVKRAKLAKKVTEMPTVKPVDQPKTETKKAYKAGEKVVLNKAPLYVSASAKVKVGTKTGTFYIYDGEKINGRYRITNKASRVNKKPTALNVTGWVQL